MRKMDATTADSLAASASRYHRARGRVRGVIVDGGRQEERRRAMDQVAAGPLRGIGRTDFDIGDGGLPHEKPACRAGAACHSADPPMWYAPEGIVRAHLVTSACG